MGLAARPMPGMAFMQMRFVLDAQAFRRESRVQLFVVMTSCIPMAICL